MNELAGARPTGRGFCFMFIQRDASPSKRAWAVVRASFFPMPRACQGGREQSPRGNPPPVYVLFAANLTRLRAERGLSMKAAALSLGVAKSTWSQWESGQRFPSGWLLGLVAQLLAVAPCQLLAQSPDRCAVRTLRRTPAERSHWRGCGSHSLNQERLSRDTICGSGSCG
jgi:DNA-binding XRE family transcriptional regulator